MDTTQTIGTGGVSTIYDGFISYSHAADGLLAPRLQSGLQRFAKPWWKRRAVRIFRDESSLSANPHLWSSITEALDSSGWFVLLLSPDAAASPWVGQEIEYWKTHRDPSRILPVLTDGNFGWADGDVTGDAVPEALEGVFSEEPRWVDLRFARDEEQLDLKNPRFSAAVADIASAVRGIPKDELESDEVKQHRRTVRTAWTAVVLVGLLAVVAVGFAISAQAERERARSRELGTAAFEALQQDPELATLLALEAVHVGGSPQDQPPVVLNALWRAIESDRLEYVRQPGEHRFGQLSLSPDDRLLAFKDEGMLAVYELPDADLLWTYAESSPDQFVLPAFSPDGTRIALSVADSRSSTFPGIDGREADELPNRILILGAETGEVLHTIEYPECEAAYAPAWSDDGALLAVTSGWGACDRAGTDGQWVEVLETDTFTPHALVPFVDDIGPFPQFLPSGDLVLLGFSSDATVLDAPEFVDGRTLADTEGFGAVSPDGRYLSTFSPARPAGQILYDLERGARVDVYPLPIFPALPVPVAFSPDSSKLIVQTEGRDTVVFDVASGTVLYELPGGAGGNPAMSSNGEWLYTSHRDGTWKAWSLAPRAVGQTVVETLPENTHVQASPPFAAGPELGAAFMLDVGQSPFRQWTALFSLENGEIIHEIDGFYQAKPLADGRFVGRASFSELGVFDPDTGNLQVIFGCVTSSESPPHLCDDTGEPAPDVAFGVSVDRSELLVRDNQTDEWWIASPDDGSVVERGSFPLPGGLVTFTDQWIAGFSDTEHLTVWDRTTGDVRTSVVAGEGPHAVSQQGDLIAVPSQGSVVFVAISTGETWTVETSIDRARGVAFSPSGARLAVGDENRLVVLDVAERSPVRELPIGGASSFYWFDEETFLMGTRFPARWVSVSLDVASLEMAGRESVTRSFTDGECARYEIDPCPTFEEIRNR